MDVSASFNSITENVQGGSNGKVVVQVIGGPLEIDFDGERRTISSYLASEIERGASSEKIGLIVAAWDQELLASINRGAVAGAPVDFLYRPMSDFLYESTSPFDIQKSLRDWYTRFLDTREQLDRVNAYITRGEEKFTEAFEFFELAQPIGPADTYRTFETPLEYAVAVRQETEDLYLQLLDFGRELYDSTNDDDFSESPIFLASIRENQIPEFELTRPRLRIESASHGRFELTAGPISGGGQIVCRPGNNFGTLNGCPNGTAVYVGETGNGLPDFFQGCASTSLTMFVTLDNYAVLAAGPSARYKVLSFFEPVSGMGNPEAHPAWVGPERNQGRRFVPVPDTENQWEFNYLVGSIGCDASTQWAQWDAWIAQDYPGLTFYLFDTKTGTIVDFYCAERGKCSGVEVEDLFEAADLSK